MTNTCFGSYSEYFSCLGLKYIFITNFQAELSTRNAKSARIGCNLNVRKEGRGGGRLGFVNVCGSNNMAEHLAAILQSQQDLFFFTTPSVFHISQRAVVQ
jgi:hypothetical protein